MLSFCFSFPVLSFRSWSYSVHVVLLCFVCHTSSGEGTTTPFAFIFTVYSFICFFFSFAFSLCQRIWIVSICMSYLSYPVRWQVIALYCGSQIVGKNLRSLIYTFHWSLSYYIQRGRHCPPSTILFLTCFQYPFWNFWILGPASQTLYITHSCWRLWFFITILLLL